MNAELRVWLVDLLSNSLFLQIAPFFILFVFPALVAFVLSRFHFKTLFYQALMGLESLAVLAPWRWLSSSSSKSPAPSHHHHHKHLTKKHARNRSEQQAVSSSDSERYYPGLVNISGTYCFMNSTLQALASLSYLQPHIDTIYEKAEILDVPTPVIDSLRQLLRRLNTPRSSYHAIRPVEIIEALTNVEGRTNALFYSREHQDAQELFQLLSECIKNEITAVDKEGKRDRGLGGLAQSPDSTKERGKSVFDGLTANRRSCVTCEYTEAVMHFSLDNLQLSLPRYAGACRLEDCLEEYTRLEILRDCVCRKCSLVATHRRLKDELANLQEAVRPEHNPSLSKQRRFKEIKRFEARVHSALEEGRIEEDLKHVRLERVVSPATKQTMIARPPPVLALHINRSIHYGQYATKNSTKLIFPEILDITPYTTSGNLSIKPTSSISTPPPSSTYSSLPIRSSTPTPSAYASQPPTLYRLSAVVCHYGQHSFGHYICYRRKPRSSGLPKEKRWAPPKLVDPLLVHELVDGESPGSRANGNAHPHPDAEPDAEHGSHTPNSDGEQAYDYPRFVWDGEDPFEPGKGWLRISDDAVRECGIETVLAEGPGAFMLYYERVVVDKMGVYPSQVPSRVKIEERQESPGGERQKTRERRSSEVDGERAKTEPYAQEYATYAKYAEQTNDARSTGTLRMLGTDSEETLKPRIKAIVMNGSVDTLVSEVGVGVASSSSGLHKRSPATSEPLSTNLAGIGAGLGRSYSLGPRIIRSVEAGRMGSSNLTRSGTNATSVSAPPRAASSKMEDKTIQPAPATTTKSKTMEDDARAESQSYHRQTNGDASYPPSSSLYHHSHSHHHHHHSHMSSSPSPSTSKPPLQQHSHSPSSPISPSKHRPNTLKRKHRHSGSGKKPVTASTPQTAAAVASAFGP